MATIQREMNERYFEFVMSTLDSVDRSRLVKFIDAPGGESMDSADRISLTPAMGDLIEPVFVRRIIREQIVGTARDIYLSKSGQIFQVTLTQEGQPVAAILVTVENVADLFSGYGSYYGIFAKMLLEVLMDQLIGQDADR